MTIQAGQPAMAADVLSAIANAIGAGTPTVSTIAALRTLTGASAYRAVVVQGYYQVGDGGGGLYQTQSSDTSSSDNGGTIILDAASRRWHLQDSGQPINVRTFGAKGDGTTDDTTAMQAAFATAVTTRKSIYIPSGNYILSAELSMDLSNDTTLTDPMPDIIGAGARTTSLSWVANASQTTGINYIGTAANNTAAFAPVRIQGLSLLKPDGNGFGLVLKQMSHPHVEDVVCYQWNYGCSCVDVQDGFFANCLFIYNLHGFQAYRNTFTEPNNFTFVGCIIGGNQNFGVDIQGGGSTNFSGGSIESNGGVGSDPGQWGARIILQPINPEESSSGVTFNATYFERNAGYGDIAFENSSGWQSTLNVVGCTFNRADPLNTGHYGTNCIRLEIANSSATTANITGCGFKGLGTYTPSNSRPYIGIVTPTQPLWICDSGNIYYSSLEAPPWPQGNMLAAAVIDGTAGALTTGKNVASFTKNSAGNYSLAWAFPGTISNPVISIVGNATVFPVLATVGATGITFIMENTSGVATDTNYVSVTVYG